MKAPHKCLVCGATPGIFNPGRERFLVHCDSCHANGPNCADVECAVSEYNRDCETIVSRVLAEALKDAPRVEAIQPYKGSGGFVSIGAAFLPKELTPGIYALIPVKEDKP